MDFWEILNYTTTIMFSACGFFLFLHFLNKVIQTRNKSKEILPFIGIMNVSFFISITYLLSGWFDYYRWELGFENFFLYKFHIIMIICSILSLTFLTEYSSKKTRYLLSIYVVICLIICLFLNNIQLLRDYSTIFGAPAFLLIPLLWYFTFIRPTSGFLRNRTLFAIGGLFLFVMGIICRNDSFRISFPPLFSLGTIGATIGLAFIGYGFAAFSTFTDLRWKGKMQELFVISNKGVCLYAFSFEKNLPLEDSDLIAGGFSGIQMLLSEIVRTQEALQLIDYKNVKILLRQTEATVFVLIIKEESPFLQYKLDLFSEEFQTFFKDTLQNWAGEIDIFTPTKTLIQRVFELGSP